VTANLTVALLIGVLYAVGTYLLLQRTLTRVVLGLGLLGHGANLLLLQAGGAGALAPFVGKASGATVGPTADPLPQAMVLTAIVITLGLTAFLLSVAYRAWQLNGHDEVQDDLEDRRIVRLAESNEVPARSTDDAGTSLAEDAALSRDETLVLPHHDGRRRRRPGIGLDDEELR